MVPSICRTASNCSGLERWLRSPVCTTKSGRTGRVYLVDRLLERAQHVGIGLAVKADVGVADLHEGTAGHRWRQFGSECAAGESAGAECIHDAGATPGHAL